MNVQEEENREVEKRVKSKNELESSTT